MFNYLKGTLEELVALLELGLIKLVPDSRTRVESLSHIIPEVGSIVSSAWPA